MTDRYDVAIVGSGFAGSLLALVARAAGRSVLVLEKGAHPRFAIGESSSPLANLLLEEIADRFSLPRLRPLSTWGTWRKTYPEMTVGLKRGFTFYRHEPGRRFAARTDRSDQLLVAASPSDEVADTHWYRPEFDHFLVEEAVAAGVRYEDRIRIFFEGERERRGLWEIRAEKDGREFTFEADLLVDASGRDGALVRALDAGEELPPGLPPTESLFTHFTGVRRLEELREFASRETPPYPVDDAAVHHVLDGAWIWVLRFSNGITSAGVAAETRVARALRLEDGEAAWRRLLDLYPSVRSQFEGALPVLPFVHAPRLGFRRACAAGDGWALLPSAAAFADPLLSTGFPLALLGIRRLGLALAEDWGTPRFADRLLAYGAATLAEADAAARLVGALYASFDDFPRFVELSKLYFAAASFSESARRLGKPHLADSFLLSARPDFGPAFRDLCERARKPLGPETSAALREDVSRAIAPFDVAGLVDGGRRRNWFPVAADDLRAAAAKLDATPEEVERLLAASGFSAAPVSSSSPAA